MDYIGKGSEFIQKAIAAEGQGNAEEAFANYMNALAWFELVLKYEKNPNVKEHVKQRMYEYVGRCEELKNKKTVPKKAQKQKGASAAGEDDENKLEDALQSVILMEKPNVSWDDVAGLELAKEALKEAIIVPIRLPHLFSDTFTSWKGILMYGPPGTGKSYLAKAIATEANATFFNVSAADLISKWVGESERLVKALFKMARERKPAIIFIDEVDSLMGARSENGGDSTARAKTQLLLEMQGVGKNESGLLVLGATNLPWSLDIAMRRRFEKKIYIPLPNKQARIRLLELNIGKSNVSLTRKDYDYLADATEGYSGADMSILVREALMSSVRKVTSATHFKLTQEAKYVPCSPGDSEAKEMSWDSVEGDLLVCPPAGIREFTISIDSIKRTVSDADIERHLTWTEEFGSTAE